MRESEIERKACQLCELHGVLHYKFVSPQRRGVPDRLLIFLGGLHWFVEFKAPDGRLSKLQIHEQKKLMKHGAKVTTVYSYEEFERHFAQALFPGP